MILLKTDTTGDAETLMCKSHSWAHQFMPQMTKKKTILNKNFIYSLKKIQYGRHQPMYSSVAQTKKKKKTAKFLR